MLWYIWITYGKLKQLELLVLKRKRPFFRFPQEKTRVDFKSPWRSPRTKATCVLLPWVLWLIPFPRSLPQPRTAPRCVGSRPAPAPAALGLPQGPRGRAGPPGAAAAPRCCRRAGPGPARPDTGPVCLTVFVRQWLFHLTNIWSSRWARNPLLLGWVKLMLAFLSSLNSPGAMLQSAQLLIPESLLCYHWLWRQSGWIARWCFVTP